MILSICLFLSCRCSAILLIFNLSHLLSLPSTLLPPLFTLLSSLSSRPPLAVPPPFLSVSLPCICAAPIPHPTTPPLLLHTAPFLVFWLEPLGLSPPSPFLPFMHDQRTDHLQGERTPNEPPSPGRPHHLLRAGEGGPLHLRLLAAAAAVGALLRDGSEL